MLDSAMLAKIKEHLFEGHIEGSNVYAIIDGAACPELRFKLYDFEPKSACLWSGALEPDLQEVAPYMVMLDKELPFTDWLLEKGWGNHWNIFVTSHLDFKALRKQIRKLLLVKSPEGNNLLFRFYDPRVMEVVLPTFVEEQLLDLFEGLYKFDFVVDNGEALVSNKLALDTHTLLQEKFKVMT